MRVEVAASSATAEISAVAPIDLTAHPDKPTVPLGPVHWIEFLTAGDWSFTDASGHTVIFTGLAAGAAYGIQVARINATPVGAKLRVGWP